MHIDNLSITSASTDGRSHHDERVFVDEIPYTSLVLAAVAGLCDEVEFESEAER